MKSKLKPGGAKIKTPKLAKRKTAAVKVIAQGKLKEGSTPMPVPISTRKREPGGDSDRGFYLRLCDEK